LHPDVEAWFLHLCRDDPSTADGISDAIDQLVEEGSGPRAPLVDRIKGSTFHNMKELRPPSTGSSEIRMSTEYTSWAEVKNKARQVDPRSVAERVIGQVAAERRETFVRGHQLAEIRKAAGITQTDLAKVLGVSQARISKIEHGDISGVDVIRAYVQGLGGTLELVASLGERSWKVA
jgi:DNA-binding transcriptional regulator YiaG